MSSATTTTTTKPSSRGNKKSKVVILHLSRHILADFPSDIHPTQQQAVKVELSPSVQPAESAADKTSESNSTPIPTYDNDEPDANSLAPPKVDGRRKRGGGTISGRKRAPPSIDPNAPPRERGRPGPKKKPRLADGTIDRTAASGTTTTNPNATPGPNGTTANPSHHALPAHKLGPKANTGAINAGLRALDRSGKPCRKWHRKGLHIKSFTGTMWGMPTWGAPRRGDGFAGEVKSDSTGSSEGDGLKGSSAVVSERSQSGGDGMVGVMGSSPAVGVGA